MLKRLSIGMLSAGAVIAASPSFAAGPVDAQIKDLQQQIQQQREQLQKQQQMLDTLVEAQKQSQAQADKAQADAEAAKQQAAQAVAAVPAPDKAGPTITMSPRNRPGWRSADGRNSVEITSLMQLDLGINSYSPASSASPLQKMQSGINARRMQIGVTSTFMEDWHADLTYDFGNTDETIGASGGPTAGFKKALVSYTGFRPFGTQSSIEFGYQTPPIFLDEALGSSNGIFLEHPTPDRLATGYASGEGRSQLGFRDYTSRFFSVLELTGPKAGDDHTAASGNEQVAIAGRYTYNFWQRGNDLFHLGVGFQRLLQPTRKSGAAFNALSLSDNAELRVDPTNVISVGFGSATNPVRAGGTYSAEGAFSYGPVLVIGEYYHYDVEREGLAQYNAQGAYGEAVYSITGERWHYAPSAGAFTNPIPNTPLSLKQHSIGALELAVRYSWANMNDHFSADNGGIKGDPAAVSGGLYESATLGLNWYPNSNVKFQLNYIHGFLDRQDASKLTETGGNWNEFAIRTQFGF